MTDGPIFLLGYDGSDGAQHAADYATTMAAGRGGRLRFAYVHNTLIEAMVPSLTPADQQASLEADHEVEIELKERMSASSVPWDLVCYRGNPFHVLLDAAEEIGAEAIVLGGTKRSGIHLSGSLAVNLVKSGRWPVIVVP